jgi:myo-inositol-1(or 4)-monophosphatase
LPSNPLFLATAIEAVVRAGDIQMARFGGDFRVDKKGAIDLVTDVDVEVERIFRAMVSERFPRHQVLAEEMGGVTDVPAGPCWVFDPIDGTTNFAHGLPIFCASLALEIDGVAEVAAVYDPNRRELFTAERGGGATLNGRPIRVSATDRLVDAMLVTGFPYDVHGRIE